MQYDFRLSRLRTPRATVSATTLLVIFYLALGLVVGGLPGL